MRHTVNGTNLTVALTIKRSGVLDCLVHCYVNIVSTGSQLYVYNKSSNTYMTKEGLVPAILKVNVTIVTNGGHKTGGTSPIFPSSIIYKNI